LIDSISKKRLKDVHPDLATLMLKAMELADRDGFTIRVSSGVRTFKEQAAAFASGASKLNGIPKNKGGTGVSEHQWGMAADLVQISGKQAIWSGNSMRKIFEYVSKASKETKVPFEWGGNWKGFVDPPHYQLPRKDPRYRLPWIS
jgi:peptidoglycan L-alanyl-D-glutamate endopeptidase CwlK